MNEVKEEILTLDEKMFTIYKINNSNLKNKTVEVVFEYIRKHYNSKFYGIGNTRFIVFNNKDINQDLIDLLHDLSLVSVPKENLQREVLS